MRLQQIKEHRLGRQARMNPRGSGETYILSGKVVCRECGRTFIRKKEQRRKECPSSGDVGPPVRGMPVLYQ